MKITHLLTALAALLSISATAENIVRNAEVNDAKIPEFRAEFGPGYKMSVFTEDLTWNKCIRLDIEKINVSDNQERVGAAIRIGGDKNPGFAVKPASTYRFSLELKGTAPRAFVGAMGFTTTAKYKGNSDLKCDLKNPIKVQKDWVRYSGTFKTNADTKFAVINISIWGASKYKDQPYKVGDYLLIDKVSVEEAPAVNLDAAPTPAAAKKKVTAK